MTTLNKKAPNFELPATNEQQIKLSKLKGQNVVLYFYPRDNTPGCTQESIDFTEHYKKFQKLNTVILGISRDSIKSHEKFKTKFEMPFDLLADEEETVCQLYNVMVLKNMYGKKVRGIERSTFLIDEDGILKQEWRKVKVPGHVEEVLETVKELHAVKISG